MEIHTGGTIGDGTVPSVGTVTGTVALIGTILFGMIIGDGITAGDMIRGITVIGMAIGDPIIRIGHTARDITPMWGE